MRDVCAFYVRIFVYIQMVSDENSRFTCWSFLWHSFDEALFIAQTVEIQCTKCWKGANIIINKKYVTQFSVFLVKVGDIFQACDSNKTPYTLSFMRNKTHVHDSIRRFVGQNPLALKPYVENIICIPVTWYHQCTINSSTIASINNNTGDGSSPQWSTHFSELELASLYI